MSVKGGPLALECASILKSLDKKLYCVSVFGKSADNDKYILTEMTSVSQELCLL